MKDVILSTQNQTFPAKQELSGKSKTGNSEQTRAAAKTAKTATANASNATGKEQNTQINKYLGIISKLENSLVKEEVPQKEINQLIERLTSKLQSLDKKMQKKLFESKEFEDLKITDIKKLQAELSEKIQSVPDRVKVFAFLKSPVFISALKDEPMPGASYTQATAQSAMKHIGIKTQA